MELYHECELRRNTQQCSAKIQVAGNHVIGQTGLHTHAPDIGRPGALNVRQAMKRRALDTEEEPQQVMSQQLVEVTEEVAVKLPAQTWRAGVIWRANRKEYDLGVQVNRSASTSHNETGYSAPTSSCWKCTRSASN